MSNGHLALVHKIAQYVKTFTISTIIKNKSSVPFKQNDMKREKMLLKMIKIYS